MKREKNIFYNLIKNETSLTEVFCNLLDYKIFRDLFLEIVNKKRIEQGQKKFDLSSIQYQNFTTEKNFGEDKNCFEEEEKKKIGRGDLILEDASGLEYIFELKIEKYTNLTDNQPKGYLCYLKKENARLFFILPRGYMHINDIYTRWHKETGYPKEEIKKHIIYWEDIIHEIRNIELDKINLFINEFCKILDYRWFYYEDIKFSKSEIELINLNNKRKKGYEMLSNSNIPSLVSKLFNIIENVKVEVKKDKASVEQYPDFYGYYVKDKRIPNEWEIWFGVDFEIWASGKSPLTIQISSDNTDDIPKIQELCGSEKFEYKNEAEDEEAIITSYIELDKTLFENNDKNIAEALEIKIHEIIDKIKK